MRTILTILAFASIAGCDLQTQAERDAATHKTCKEAGLETKQGTSMAGGLALYCAPPEVSP